MNTTDADAAERERWARFFLARLNRLCHFEERLVSPPEAVTKPRHLLSKAVFATYCDCVSLGRKAEADHLLARCKFPGDLPTRCDR
jgi:hypothetical protein